MWRLTLLFTGSRENRSSSLCLAALYSILSEWALPWPQVPSVLSDGRAALSVKSPFARPLSCGPGRDCSNSRLAWFSTAWVEWEGESGCDWGQGGHRVPISSTPASFRPSSRWRNPRWSWKSRTSGNCSSQPKAPSGSGSSSSWS